MTFWNHLKHICYNKMLITTEIFLIRKGKLKPTVCFIRSLGKTEFFRF